MKKYQLILIMIMLLMLSGCENSKETSSEIKGNTTETQGVKNEEKDVLLEVQNGSEISTEDNTEVVVEHVDEELSLMQKVLLNKAKYYEVSKYSDGWKTVEDNQGFCEYDEDSSNYFYVLDLDKDGIDEVCVAYGSGAVLIFREQNGEIYGYTWYYKNFDPVYADGTFFCGSGSVGIFYGNVSFEGNEFNYDIIAAWESELAESREYVTHYYKDGSSKATGLGIEISKDECDEILSQYPRELATAYDFTIENILKYVQ